jgi:glyoxylase-like metal-dependent hydrolase (beta-lactamase superfamily II)
MRKKLTLALVMLALTPWAGQAQDAKAVLDGAVKAMGDVNSLQFSGSGAYFAFGQAYTPGAEWPRFGVKSYSRTVDYKTPAMRDEYVRADGDPTARGGGAPLPPGQRATQAVSGNLAWNQVGENPPVAAPAAVADRLHQLWITPHGVLKAAANHNAAVETKSDGDKKTTSVSFAVPDLFKAQATVNDKNLVEKVESWSTDPVLGDTLTETVYVDYKDFEGVRFPTKISQKRGGQPTLDLAITEAKANIPADIKAPDSVTQAAVRVQADKIADGVWYLTGGTHHSVLVEMSDHLIVIEGPQNDARAIAVIEEAKKLVPNKPIKYVVNTHKHFDHAGGLAAFAADGAIVVTHDASKAFLEKSLSAPRTVQPDKLAKSGKKPVIEGMQEKRVLSDGTRTVELHLIQGTTHDDGIIMAYLPKEKLLVEADVFTPAAVNAPRPAQPNPNSVALNDNIDRLNLTVEQILPLHGRKVSLAEFQAWIGKGS